MPVDCQTKEQRLVISGSAGVGLNAGGAGPCHSALSDSFGLLPGKDDYMHRRVRAAMAWHGPDGYRESRTTATSQPEFRVSVSPLDAGEARFR